MTNTGLSQSPPASARFDARSNSKSSSDLQFDLPKFGALPASQFFDNQAKRTTTTTTTPPGNGVAHNAQPLRQNSQGSSYSSAVNAQNTSTAQNAGSKPGSRNGSVNTTSSLSNIDAFNNTLPQMPSSLFSPSLLNSASTDYGFANPTASPQNIDNGGDSNSGISRAFRSTLR